MIFLQPEKCIRGKYTTLLSGESHGVVGKLEKELREMVNNNKCLKRVQVPPNNMV